MAARATASGNISFGLVSIPVKVYTATSSKTVRFSMLHESDKSRVRQQLVCSSCDEIVERNETVKGYEYQKGQYVVLQQEELKALEKKSDQSIEIEEFIPIEQIDPLYFEKSNLLGPDKGGSKAYRLLHRSMQESGKVALGRYSARGKQQLVLLRPTEDGLTMHGLYYADEVRSFDDVELGDEVEFKQGELDLAAQLIDTLTTDGFEPEKYEDAYRQSVLEVVDRKVAGEETVLVEAPESRERIIDLVAALKQSLREKSAEGAKAGTDRKQAKAKRPAKQKKSATG